MASNKQAKHCFIYALLIGSLIIPDDVDCQLASVGNALLIGAGVPLLKAGIAAKTMILVPAGVGAAVGAPIGAFVGAKTGAIKGALIGKAAIGAKIGLAKAAIGAKAGLVGAKAGLGAAALVAKFKAGKFLGQAALALAAKPIIFGKVLKAKVRTQFS